MRNLRSEKHNRNTQTKMDFTTVFSNVRFADLSNIAQIKRWGSITIQNGNKMANAIIRT